MPAMHRLRYRAYTSIDSMVVFEKAEALRPTHSRVG